MHFADLLAALAVGGLVLAATLTVFAQGQRAYTHGVARLESQQSARIALARMAREIRQAGLGAGASLPIAVAEPSRLVIRSGPGTVTWLLSGNVLRRNAGGGAQPIVNGVRALAFTYLDAGGLPTTSPAAIRTVLMTLTVEPEHPGTGGATRATLTTEVRLRNR